MGDRGFLSRATPFAIAHRGGNEAAPENTEAAFAHARSLGIDHLETDVHLTADGVLVAFHDPELDRVAKMSGSIADRVWSELTEIELEGGHRIPTMASLLERFPDARFNIDPKADASVDPLIELLREHEAVDRVCIGAFSDQRIARLSDALGPSLCTSAGPKHIAAIVASAQAGRLAGALQTNPLVQKIADQHGCLQVPVKRRNVRIVDDPLIETAHALGLQVHVWTVNDEAEMHRLLDAGVDAIITDKVSVLRRVLDARSEHSR